VQTYSPDHPAIELAREHDFLSFAKQELEHREKFQYPPFGSIARIIIRGLDPAVTEAFANSITQTVEKIRALQGSNQVRFLGPAAPPLAKLKTFYRFHIMFVAEEPGILNRLLTRVHAELKPPKDVEYVIDIDPVDML
jgi:primosomal protein N' (replication factor Y)